MHDVLEGSVQVEICCLLRKLIREKKVFTLAEVNKRIKDLPWGLDAKDHPPRPLPDSCITEEKCTHLKLGGMFVSV